VKCFNKQVKQAYWKQEQFQEASEDSKDNNEPYNTIACGSTCYWDIPRVHKKSDDTNWEPIKIHVFIISDCCITTRPLQPQDVPELICAHR